MLQKEVDRNTSALNASLHACKRLQQRAVRAEVLEFVLKNYDRGCFVGDGRRSAFITRRKLAWLREQGAPAGLVERANGVILVLAPTSERVVTVMHWQRGSGARYTRQFPTWNTSELS
jgi:hypothetical protein